MAAVARVTGLTGPEAGWVQEPSGSGKKMGACGSESKRVVRLRLLEWLWQVDQKPREVKAGEALSKR